MGIAQIALDPAPLLLLCQTAKYGIKTILASLYIPGQTCEKSAPNHPGPPLHPLLSSYAHMETAHFKKGFPKSMTPKTQRHSGQIVHTLHKLQTHIDLQPPTPNPQHVPAS